MPNRASRSLGAHRERPTRDVRLCHKCLVLTQHLPELSPMLLLFFYGRKPATPVRGAFICLHLEIRYQI